MVSVESDELPECSAAFDKVRCCEVGEHLCEPRANHFRSFCAKLLVHTKGAYAGKPFILSDWQWEKIVRPLFGTVVWSEEWDCYVRRYTQAYIEIARKNGKSELLSAIVLYLLIADGEESAEVYGMARTRDQAKLVYEVVKRMVELSDPLLARISKRGIIAHAKRVIDAKSNSKYECIPADEKTALGTNPSGGAADELAVWRDRGLWDSATTGSDTRKQPLIVAATTAGTDLSGFGKSMHDEKAKLVNNPDLNRHIFVFIRNSPRSESELEELRANYPGDPDLPVSLDVFDERNWRWPNPALGDFLKISGLRRAADEAREEPQAEQAFRVFRMNQWLAQTFRYMPMHLWEKSSKVSWESPSERESLAGQRAYGGLDLASKHDLTAWCVLLPSDDPGGRVSALWRFWLPEGALPGLDKAHNGAFTQWAEQGWLTVTPGAVVNYESVYADIQADGESFVLSGFHADEWSSMPVIQAVQTRLHLPEDRYESYTNNFQRMSPGMDGVMGLVKSGRLEHYGNPIAAFCFRNVMVKRAPFNKDLVRPEKPDRSLDSSRIDAVPAIAMAYNAMDQFENYEPESKSSAYETRGLIVA
jgi:phage terminase large subunit-like protein